MASDLRSWWPSFFLLAGLATACDYSLDSCGAWADGDIRIGVLNSCHSQVDNLDEHEQPMRLNCSELNLLSFVRTLAVIHSIETINNSSFLPGVRLGYYICDTCSNPTKAVQSIEHLLALNITLPISCNLAERQTQIKAIIGARFSEVSISIARILSLHMIPQISTTSSAEALSDRLRYPSFLRTVPSDVHQTTAVVQLMAHYGWKWVGVVYGDDDYGISAFHSFQTNAEVAGVCIEFEEKLPHHLNSDDIDKTVEDVVEIILSAEAKVILLILKSQLVQKVFEAMIRMNISRTWIASDAWSMSEQIATMEGINKLGDIFGFSFITGQIPGFEEFLKRLSPRSGAVNYFIKEYKQLGHDDSYLLQAVKISLAYSENLAVWSIAYALRNLLRCDQTDCPGEKDFPPWKLLKELKRVNFTKDKQDFYFSKSGNLMTGYDLINWIRDEASGKRRFKVVGSYSLERDDIKIREAIAWDNPNNTVPESKCSEDCPPGTAMQLSKTSCCFNCTECLEGTYSNDTNMHQCLSCPDGTWALKGRTYCEAKTEKYWFWYEAFAISVLTITGLGFLIVIANLILFATLRMSPVMRQAGGYMFLAMLAGLAVSFGSVILFIGRPNVHVCRARQIMYGLGFTLTASCILAKALRTFLAFLPPHQQHTGQKFYKPKLVIIGVTSIQALICVFWLIFDSPSVEIHDFGQEILMECIEGSNIGFAFMLGYIALLALICFLLAFKGRKVPQRFNETGYIIFSMLIYLFVWVCFTPLYVSKIQESARVEASAILVSNYGVIFCHFVPKWYMALCKKKEDITTEAYKERARISICSSASRPSMDSGMMFYIADSQTTMTQSDYNADLVKFHEDNMGLEYSKNRVTFAPVRKRSVRRTSI